MRHRSTGRLWNQPAIGEIVAVARPGPKLSLEPRGQVGRYMRSQTWTHKVTYMLVADHQGREVVKH
eukprot:9053544-Prorocentrum_lima.AAC.1